MGVDYTRGIHDITGFQPLDILVAGDPQPDGPGWYMAGPLALRPGWAGNALANDPPATIRANGALPYQPMATP